MGRPMAEIDVIMELRHRGWPSLKDRKAAVDAVGLDVEKAETWLKQRLWAGRKEAGGLR